MSEDNENSKNIVKDCDRGLVLAFRIGLVTSVLLLLFNIMIAVMIFSEGLDYGGRQSRNIALLSVVGIFAHATLAILCRNKSRDPALPWAMIAAGVLNLMIGLISIGAGFWLRHELRRVSRHSD